MGSLAQCFRLNQEYQKIAYVLLSESQLPNGNCALFLSFVYYSLKNQYYGEHNKIEI